MPIDISIILPASKLNDDLIRCVYSIKTALEGKLIYEILIITPYGNDIVNILTMDNIFFKIEGVPGIYQAMNMGINDARGTYLYFMGQDDILLPSVVEAIILGNNTNADLIIADVFWGKNKIYKNISSRKFLVWKNWCQQGILYRRLRFMKEIGQYPVQYKSQADHYVNIVFSSTPFIKIARYNGCIAWYSADGFSTRSLDLVFREIFPDIVRTHIGFSSYCFVIIRRALLRLFRI
jgi:hypothetical protein